MSLEIQHIKYSSNVLTQIDVRISWKFPVSKSLLVYGDDGGCVQRHCLTLVSGSFQFCVILERSRQPQQRHESGSGVIVAQLTLPLLFRPHDAYGFSATHVCFVFCHLFRFSPCFPPQILCFFFYSFPLSCFWVTHFSGCYQVFRAL